MRVTVIGGAGYIGSGVGEVLLRDDLDVHVIDNLVKGRRAAVTDAALFEAVDLADRCAVASSLRDFGSQAAIDGGVFAGGESGSQIRQSTTATISLWGCRCFSMRTRRSSRRLCAADRESDSTAPAKSGSW